MPSNGYREVALASAYNLAAFKGVVLLAGMLIACTDNASKVCDLARRERHDRAVRSADGGDGEHHPLSRAGPTCSHCCS